MRTLPSRQSGQMIPIFAMVIFSGMMLLIAAVNVYRVTKAKLAAQNIADAVALTVASMQAKDINVTIDRNEWLNHLYEGIDPSAPPDKDCNRLPPISRTDDPATWGSDKCAMSDSKAKGYAVLVSKINKAQDMFHEAYNRFSSADDDSNSLPSSNVGLSGLNEVLSEIDGINDGKTHVVVFNTDNDAKEAESKAEKLKELNKGNLSSFGNIIGGRLKAVPYKYAEVNVRVKSGGKKFRTLTEILNNGTPVGWKYPVWDDKNSGLTVNTGKGRSPTIGAGAIVIRKVDLIFPLIRTVSVQAQARAYVVKESGYSRAQDGKAPKQFRPTYYVKLGNPL